MQGLIMAAQLITGISLLVIIHELGHYWAARMFGIRVEKFYLFFDAWGFKLFSIKRGDTEWGIGWLPLGGYVKIAGMIDESMDKEQLKKPAEPWEFRSKPAWQRLIVMVGGVFMNIVAGIFIFAMMAYSYGERYTVNESLQYGIVPSELAQEIGFKYSDKLISVNGKDIKYLEEAMDPNEMFADNAYYEILREGEKIKITLPSDFIAQLSKQQRADFFAARQTFAVAELVAGYNAEKAGLQKGDIIRTIDTMPIRFFDDLQSALKISAGKTVAVGIIRKADSLSLNIPVDETGKIGLIPATDDVKYDTLTFGLIQSFPKGVEKAVSTIALQITGWKKIANGDIPANKAVQGPIGIAKFYGGEWIWARFWLFTALISLGLAFMNILPIPALDGGHVVLLCIEMITGKPLSDRTMEIVQTIGMVILLTLMVLIFGNDIWQLLTN